jgi:hypothetical protein
MEIQDDTGKDSSETDDKNKIQKRFISSQTFHRTPGGRVREITVEVQFHRHSPSHWPICLQLASDVTSAIVPHAPPAVAPPSVFRPDWKTLSRLASTPSKPIDLDVCPTSTSLHRFCGITDKLKSTWFWVPNQEIVVMILRSKSPNQSCRFWGTNQETLHHLGFEAQPRNRPLVLRPNREKPSPLVLRSSQRKLSQQVLRPNR